MKPDDAGAHYNLGKACESAGQMKEAMTHYSLEIRAKPDYAEPITIWAPLWRLKANSRKPSFISNKPFVSNPIPPRLTIIWETSWRPGAKTPKQ